MKQNVKWMAIALMMATITVGCESGESSSIAEPTPNEPVTIEDNQRQDIILNSAQTEMVNESNDFAFNLFRQVASEESEIVSPISITYALGMLNNGAAGETQEQINKVLGFSKTGAAGINEFCKKMLAEAPKLDKLTKVMIANNIYFNSDKNYVLYPDFVNKAKLYYEADVESRSFTDGQTMNVINQWASDHTEKMIDKVLDENSFNTSAASYLLNAIYFKGTWSAKFETSNTQNETFHGYTAETTVPMMYQNSNFKYTETADFQALRMPYGNGAYAMTILLPKEGKTISDVLNTLTAKKWEMFQLMADAIVDVKLPRFESTSNITLNKIMATLGMPNAFDIDLAEFPNFCPVDTYIGLMKQVAKIKLNEEGTEAAAVTVIAVNDKVSIEPEPMYVDFHATRPFLYVISEQSTGAIFFIGQYMGD